MDETSLVINMDDYAARMSLYIYLEWQYHKTNYSKSPEKMKICMHYNYNSSKGLWKKGYNNATWKYIV